jgi:uncharacterized membrane protein YgcG
VVVKTFLSDVVEEISVPNAPWVDGGGFEGGGGEFGGGGASGQF